MKKARFLLLCAPLLMLPGCATTTGVTDITDLDGPVYGKRDETKFVAGTDGSAAGLGDLARVAKTIRKYKNLGAGEREIIRRVAALKLDGLVAGEMRKLAPQFERRKTAVRQQTQQKVVAVRRRAAAERKPAAAVEREVAVLQTEEKSEIRKIDLAWKSAAVAEVAKTRGTDFAVPVQNPEGKAVVAFAKLSESGVSVSSAAYELAGGSSALVSAARSGREISHENKSYALLNAPVELQ